MSNSTYFRPMFDVHGLQSCHDPFNIVNQVHLRPHFFPNAYPNDNRPTSSPIFRPNNSQINNPISFSLERGHQSVQIPTTILSEAPIMPRDPEMLKNIDLLSGLVVKQGLCIEKMTQEKEANNPKFGFLFESEGGTEAAIGKFYYEWKKNALRATFHPQHQPTSSSNHDCGEPQAPPPSSSHHHDGSPIQIAQNNLYNSFDQPSTSSGGIDMEIEDDYEEPITSHMKKNVDGEDLKIESNATTFNTSTLMLMNKIDDEIFKESQANKKCTLLKKQVEDGLVANEYVMNEENEPHSTNYDVNNALHQIFDNNKIEDIIDDTPNCCIETCQNETLIQREIALVDLPLEKVLEKEDKETLESHEKIYRNEIEIEKKVSFEGTQDDAFENNSIETMDFEDEEKSLETEDFGFENCLSNGTVKEEHGSPKPNKSSKDSLHQLLLSTSIDSIPQNFVNTTENFDSKDFVTNVDDEQKNCSCDLKLANKTIENQLEESNTIDINLQTHLDASKALLFSTNQTSIIALKLKTNDILLDEFGRIMNYEDNCSEDNNLNSLVSNKTLNEEYMKNNDLIFANQNFDAQSPNSSPSLEFNSKQKQSFIQNKKKEHRLSIIRVDHGYNKNCDQIYQNVHNGNNVKSRRFGKCKHYARGYCHRGNDCWFEHSINEIIENYDAKCKKDPYYNNKTFKQKNWQVISEKNCCGNTSSDNGAKNHNKKSEHDEYLEKNKELHEFQSKSLDDYGLKRFDTHLDKKKLIDKIQDSGLLCCNVNSEDKNNQNESKSKQKSWQEDVEENSNNCNSYSNTQDKNLYKHSKEKQTSFEKITNCSKSLSNHSNCEKYDNHIKHDDFSTKLLKDTKEVDHEVLKKKSLLSNTTSSSDHHSAVSSTASFEHTKGVSTLNSSILQTSMLPQVSQKLDITTLPTESSTPPEVPQSSKSTTLSQFSMIPPTPQVSNSITPIQTSMPLQVSQILNPPMVIGNNQRELLSKTSINKIVGNISNSTSLNTFIPNQTMNQTNTLHLPSNNLNMVYPASFSNNAPNIFSSNTFNFPPPIQYPKLYNPISQNFKIQQDKFVQPSHLLHATSTTQHGDRSLLPSFSNSQYFLQNTKHPYSSLLQNDFNLSHKFSLQPYSYVQSSILNKVPQQQYIMNSIPQVNSYLHTQNNLQPTFRVPPPTNPTQSMNQRFCAPPPPTFKYNSLLTPTSLSYSTRPIEASIPPQNYVVPPPPPPLESNLPKEYNTFESYVPTHIYSATQKSYFVNSPHETTTMPRPTSIPMLPSERLQKPDHDDVVPKLDPDNVVQPYTVETPTFDNVSPIGEGGQSWTGTKGDEVVEGNTIGISKHNQKKKGQFKVRGLTLLKKSVARYVKDLLKPKWREGIMTKEAYKTIIKKTVDKVSGTVKPNHVPNNDEKVANYMNAAQPKILKLVQGYVSKYVKA